MEYNTNFDFESYKQDLKERMRELVSSLHDEFCFSGLATEQQWNEVIAPKLRDLALGIDGYKKGTPTARVYKFPSRLDEDDLIKPPPSANVGETLKTKGN